MDEVYDLSGKLREWLLDQSSIVAYVDKRIFTPVIFGKNGEHGYEDETNPKIMFRQEGDAEGYRYFFLVEDDEGREERCREVATALYNSLVRRQLSLSAGSPERVVVRNAMPVGGMNDSRNETNRYAQVFFSLNFLSV